MRHVQGSIRRAPVVDHANCVMDLVRESDLFVKKKEVPFSRERLPALFDEWVDLTLLEEAYKMARHHTAGEGVISEVSCIQLVNDIEEVVQLMEDRELESIPVVGNGELVGIISRADWLRIWATTG